MILQVRSREANPSADPIKSRPEPEEVKTKEAFLQLGAPRNPGILSIWVQKIVKGKGPSCSL